MKICPASKQHTLAIGLSTGKFLFNFFPLSTLLHFLCIFSPYGDDERGHGQLDFEPAKYGNPDQLSGWLVSDFSRFNLSTPASVPGTFDPTRDGPPTSNPRGWYMQAPKGRLCKLT